MYTSAHCYETSGLWADFGLALMPHEEEKQWLQMLLSPRMACISCRILNISTLDIVADTPESSFPGMETVISSEDDSKSLHNMSKNEDLSFNLLLSRLWAGLVQKAFSQKWENMHVALFPHTHKKKSNDWDYHKSEGEKPFFYSESFTASFMSHTKLSSLKLAYYMWPISTVTSSAMFGLASFEYIVTWCWLTWVVLLLTTAFSRLHTSIWSIVCWGHINHSLSAVGLLTPVFPGLRINQWAFVLELNV